MEKVSYKLLFLYSYSSVRKYVITTYSSELEDCTENFVAVYNKHYVRISVNIFGL